VAKLFINLAVVSAERNSISPPAASRKTLVAIDMKFLIIVMQRFENLNCQTNKC
jgi:hypothetical protein